MTPKGVETHRLGTTAVQFAGRLLRYTASLFTSWELGLQFYAMLRIEPRVSCVLGKVLC